MALEGSAQLQQSLLGLAEVKDRRKKQELEEAKYSSDVAEQSRKRSSQMEIGEAFSKTPEGRTGLGQVQSLGLSSGELSTGAAVDPWLQMSKEQKTFWLISEAERNRDPELRMAAKKAINAMNDVNYAQSFYSTAGRLKAENAYKSSGDGAGGTKMKQPLNLNTSTIINKIKEAYPDGVMEISKGSVPGLKKNIKIDLNEGGIYDQLNDQTSGGIFSSEVSPEVKHMLHSYIVEDLHKNIKEGIKADKAVYQNPAAEPYLDRDAKLIGSRFYLGGFDAFSTQDEKGNKTTMKDFAVEDLPKSFYDLSEYPINPVGVVPEVQINPSEEPLIKSDVFKMMEEATKTVKDVSEVTKDNNDKYSKSIAFQNAQIKKLKNKSKSEREEKIKDKINELIRKMESVEEKISNPGVYDNVQALKNQMQDLRREYKKVTS